MKKSKTNGTAAIAPKRMDDPQESPGQILTIQERPISVGSNFSGTGKGSSSTVNSFEKRVSVMIATGTAKAAIAFRAVLKRNMDLSKDAKRRAK
mmetsp:Transcript_101339/g.159842  ORF Transcript_101339/g.159842 Transcript_101339/m.159842 type:complete len:94 (-) Transcript_101339:562-843(-)